MQKWIIADEIYLSYLRQTEARIPNSNYGEYHYKPFFGELFSIDDLVYVSQVSSAKPRHFKMKNSKDFYKLYISDSIDGGQDKLVAVVNLNYMFPIPKKLINYLEMKDIDQVRQFRNESEKNKYIDFLNKELSALNTLKIDDKAKSLYDFTFKYPDHPISSRCFDFKLLEQVAMQYGE